MKQFICVYSYISSECVYSSGHKPLLYNFDRNSLKLFITVILINQVDREASFRSSYHKHVSKFFFVFSTDF